MILEQEVIDVQKSWADAIVKIGNLYLKNKYSLL